MLYYQQGDVLLKMIDNLPEGLTPTADRILQHGEVTGHRHRFLDDANVQVFLGPVAAGGNIGNTITPLGKRKFLVVNGMSALHHEEHKPVHVEPGIYEIDIVREYDYDTKETRAVID